MTDKTIAELAKAVEDATELHNSAKRDADRARSAETGARNRLNDAQKAFDAAVDKLRGSARAGDWMENRQRRPGGQESV